MEATGEQVDDTILQMLGPKEVAPVLGVSARTVQRLMSDGEIEAARIGRKIWRTTPEQVQEYITRRMMANRRRPEVRMLEQTIVCMCELRRLGRLDDADLAELERLEISLDEALSRHKLMPGAKAIKDEVAA